ncbi:hypothetical protein ABMA32_19120 [Mesorhizobium sp. VNQ89]|uniref:hypothetical protein n=1 Tax=Mesorhizobium quangtriensis TaxID=3157709 RepID=UPI0032B75016
MKRPDTYRKGAADALSAFFLFVAMLLAGGYGPLASSAPAAPQTVRTAPVDAGTGGQRSVPVLSKQQTYLSESEDATSSSSDEGKAKAIVVAGFELPASSVEIAHDQPVVSLLPPLRAASFSARAPPAQS